MVRGLSVSFYEGGEVVSEITLNPGESAIYDAQSSSSGIRLSSVAGASAIVYEMSTIGGKVAQIQEDVAQIQEDIIGFDIREHSYRSYLGFICIITVWVNRNKSQE